MKARFSVGETVARLDGPEAYRRIGVITQVYQEPLDRPTRAGEFFYWLGGMTTAVYESDLTTPEDFAARVLAR